MGRACTIWLPPGARNEPSGLVEQLRLLPFYARVFGCARLGHPTERHFHLAFMAVSTRYQGTGSGSAILGATLKRIDDAGAAAYPENSNPKNTDLYERAGFVARKNIAPDGAPPLVAMWRSTPVS
jgi:GNAT superfamily N-acetyltransferase